MAKEKPNSNEEKLEIEDILAEPVEESGSDLDLEEAVSEVETSNEPELKSQNIVTKEVKTVTKEIKKEKEKSEKPKETPENKVPEKTELKVENTTVVKKRSLVSTIAIVILTMLVTAAAVLGAVWWFYRGNTKTEEPKAETKVDETAVKKTETTVYVSASEGLKLRKEASSTSQQLALIPYGTALEIAETEGDWIKTTYQNQTGWVNSAFTTKVKPFDADWKAYSGSGFDSAGPKFSIKYPGDWSINDYKITKIDAGKTYKIALGEGGHGFPEDETITSTQESATYNGNTAKKIVLKRSGSIIFIGVQFDKSPVGTTQIEFTVPEGYNPTYIDLFEKILSTINFS